MQDPGSAEQRTASGLTPEILYPLSAVVNMQPGGWGVLRPADPPGGKGMNAELWECICELKGYVDACVDSDQGNGDGVPFAMLEAIQTKVNAVKAAKTLDDSLIGDILIGDIA
jgi:hypothetical protein